MVHFHRGDLVVSCVAPTGASPVTNHVVHCDPDGVIIDTHPLPGPVDPFRTATETNLQAFRFDDRGGLLYIGTNNQRILRFDDNWSGGEFYVHNDFKYNGSSVPDPTEIYGLNFNHETGELFAACKVDEIGQHVLIIVGADGELVYEFEGDTLNIEADEANITFDTGDYPRLYYSNSNSNLYRFTAFSGADPDDEETFFNEPTPPVVINMTGTAIDDLARRLYFGVLKGIAPSVWRIRVIDMPTQAVVNTYDLTPFAMGANGLDISPDKDRLYATGGTVLAGDHILILDIATGDGTVADLSESATAINYLHVLGADLVAGGGPILSYSTWLA